MAKKKKLRDVLAAAYEMADDLYRAGVIDKKTLDRIKNPGRRSTTEEVEKEIEIGIKDPKECGKPLEELRKEIKRGLDSGEPTPLDIELVKARGRKRLVRIGIKDPEESFQDVIDAWHRAERGEPPEEPIHRIYFQNIETLLRVLDEAVKMKRCPGITFAPGASGRRARVKGTGIEVWEIIAQYRALNNDRKRLRRAFDWLSPAQINAALDYHAAYPDEIDERIRRNDPRVSDNHDLPSAFVRDILAAKKSGVLEPFVPKKACY